MKRTIEHCVLGLRLRVEEGAVLQDTLAMGADSTDSEAERQQVRSRGGVPLGIGAHSVIQRAILDKNVRIGSDVKVINKDRVPQRHCGDREERHNRRWHADLMSGSSSRLRQNLPKWGLGHPTGLAHAGRCSNRRHGHLQGHPSQCR